jgi:hypothetical protein
MNDIINDCNYLVDQEREEMLMDVTPHATYDRPSGVSCGLSNYNICVMERLHKVFRKEFYIGIPNVTMWRVLWKRLHLKTCKVSIVNILLSLHIFWNTLHLLVEVTLNYDYPTYNSMCFATMWQFETLYKTSE